jgi:hypothetical protein
MKCKAWVGILGATVMLSGVAAAQQLNPRDYTVAPDFSNVTNWKAVSEVYRFTDEQRDLLQRNKFVVIPGNYWQLYHPFGENLYEGIPNFVPVDVSLQLYHLFFSSTLRVTEEQKFHPILLRLSGGMLRASLAQAEVATNPAVRSAALRNAAYFGTGLQLLGASIPIPEETKQLIDQEVARINDAQGFGESAIFPYNVDYSQFIVRGHYTKSPKLSQYFKGLMWYGLMPIAFVKDGNRDELLNEQILQTLLISRILTADSQLRTDWQRVYEPTEMYVGPSNTFTFSDIQQIADRIFGENVPFDRLADTSLYAAFVEEAERQEKAIIGRRLKEFDDMPDPKLQFRFMGQRYVPDSEMLQTLSGDMRAIPSGLDVMAVLGSIRAAELLDADPDRYNPLRWAEYNELRTQLTRAFTQIPQATWQSNLYWGWLYAIQSLLKPAPEIWPSFMKSEAYAEKSLNTALASWTALRHDTILYAQQSVAQMGGGDPPETKGYVEPNLEFYDRMVSLTRMTRDGLKERDLLVPATAEQFEDFLGLLEFLRRVSRAQLEGAQVSREDYDRLMIIEDELHGLTTRIIISGTEYQVIGDDDADIALVADVHTGRIEGQDFALTQAIGHGDPIFVVVPIEGRLYIARGAVYSYYEFLVPISERMTNRQWKEKVREEKELPARPDWVRSFLSRTTLPVANPMD